MKARELLRVLRRQPLAYVAKRSPGGSHRRLTSANGYPDLTWAHHDGATLPPGLVRKILRDQVGLTEDEAAGLL